MGAVAVVVAAAVADAGDDESVGNCLMMEEELMRRMKMREDCWHCPWRAEAESRFDEWIEQPAVVEWTRMTSWAEPRTVVGAAAAAVVVVKNKSECCQNLRSCYCWKSSCWMTTMAWFDLSSTFRPRTFPRAKRIVSRPAYRVRRASSPTRFAAGFGGFRPLRAKRSPGATSNTEKERKKERKIGWDRKKGRKEGWYERMGGKLQVIKNASQVPKIRSFASMKVR